MKARHIVVVILSVWIFLLAAWGFVLWAGATDDDYVPYLVGTIANLASWNVVSALLVLVLLVTRLVENKIYAKRKARTMQSPTI
jgi:hypothetical protein